MSKYQQDSRILLIQVANINVLNHEMFIHLICIFFFSKRQIQTVLNEQLVEYTVQYAQFLIPKTRSYSSNKTLSLPSVAANN
jgi:hypothetical protein